MFYNLFYDRSRYWPCHGLLLRGIEYVFRQKTRTSSRLFHGGSRVGNDGCTVGKWMYLRREKFFLQLAQYIFLQLIHMLLDIYGFRGTTLIAGGWALHSVVGSCLLRPLEPSAPPVEVIILIHIIIESSHSPEFLTNLYIKLLKREYIILLCVFTYE